MSRLQAPDETLGNAWVIITTQGYQLMNVSTAGVSAMSKGVEQRQTFGVLEIPLACRFFHQPS